MEQNKKSASVKMALVYATLILLTFLCLLPCLPHPLF